MIWLWLLSRLPWLSRIPWRLAGIGALAALLLWAGWHVRGRLAQAQADRLALATATQKLSDLAAALATAEMVGKADAAAAVAYATEAAQAQRQADQLRQAVFVAAQRAQFVTTRRDPDATRAPEPVLSRGFRLCFNAAASGDPEAAAACEAGSGNAAGGAAVPAAALVRPGQPR